MFASIVKTGINMSSCLIKGHEYFAKSNSLREGSIAECRRCGKKTPRNIITKG